jgi:ornithine cyclodeaminase/alanine dehydrogenase-like protein (mu-crystallin family)
MLILNADEVRAAITMPEAIDAVRVGFIALSDGRATVPLRSSLSTPRGINLYMPAYIHGEPISTVKTVSVYPGNVAHNLPNVIGSILVLDAETGLPLALLDGTSLTALRTGAASGLATDLLALTDANILGVIGAGVQARTQIEAICAVRPIRQIRIFSRRGERAHAMADELRKQHDAEIIVAISAHEALIGAQILVAATNSKTPVIHLADVSPGAHINGIGSFTSEMQEIAADVLTHAKIVVDHRESIWTEAGELIQARDKGLISESNIHAEIGEVAAGHSIGRTGPDEITFFKSVGNAVQDAAVAARIISAAAQRGLGTSIKLQDYG